MSIAAPNGTSAPELIFHRYGGQYFLAEIRLGDGHARELFPSRKEKELARAHAGTEVALLARGVAQK